MRHNKNNNIMRKKNGTDDFSILAVCNKTLGNVLEVMRMLCLSPTVSNPTDSIRHEKFKKLLL